MKSRVSTRAVVASVVLAVMLLLAAGVGVSLAEANADCSKCHAPTVEETTARPHAAVPCVRCHASSAVVGKVRFGAGVTLGMRLRLLDMKRSDIVAIPDSRCESCHTKNRDEVVGTAVKIRHATCAAGDACVRCHGQTAHKASQPISALDMFECLDCHTRSAASLACNSCHEGRLPEERVNTGTFAVTHGKDWKRNHGLGSINACVACHDQQDCARCHGAGVPHGQYFILNHGQSAASGQSKCTSCHRKSYCDTCHGLEMPHPSGFKIDHPRFTSVLGEKVCKRCHASSDCDTCHTLHVHPGGAIGGGAAQ